MYSRYPPGGLAWSGNSSTGGVNSVQGHPTPRGVGGWGGGVNSGEGSVPPKVKDLTPLPQGESMLPLGKTYWM